MYRILHVDDDPVFLELFRLRFEEEFEIESVTRVEDALITLSNGGYDLVLTDYILGESTGLDLLERIREMNPNLPVVFFTGYEDNEVVEEAFARGASGFLFKDLAVFVDGGVIVGIIKNEKKSRSDGKVRFKHAAEKKAGPMYFFFREGNYLPALNS